MRIVNVLGVTLAVSAVGLAGCSGEPGSGEPTASESSAVSTWTSEAYAHTTSFVTLAAGASGGYEVSSANESTSPTHVGQLDFSRSGFDAATIAVVTGAPTSELVLEGSVASGTLFVTAAYRGMPGVSYESSSTFYQAGGPVARALNENVTRKFTSVDVSAAAQPFVQSSWLANEVSSRNAIVAGHVTQASKTLSAQQVFIALPYVGGPCAILGHICPLGDTAAFTRDQNLCMDYQGCVARTVCPEFVPYCGAGYVLQSWDGPEGGCQVYACDPAFIH